MELRDKKPLSPELWRDVEHIFIEALDLPSEERARYLGDACGENETLRQEIDSLLDAHISTVGLLDAFDAERAAGLLRDELPATHLEFGPYRVVRELGRGGMGTVYEAHRADGQFEQKVALKVIKAGLGSASIVQRFLNERQILATLQHPHIARLIDGGIDEGGQPYFAMEFIDGQPITTYCDAKRLTIDDRLNLFLRVCEAVRYAHRNLVIHRDLKPGNILVTNQGDVKLLDFGIAKVLEGAGDGYGMLDTESGVHAMTPEYASPEQVKGEAITTSTDVYALGVILYELLTGSRPYHFDRKSMSDVVMAICDVEPVRPVQSFSNIRSNNEEAFNHITTSRSISEGRLRRLLKGDLEAILLKALQKQPDERYVSVEAMQEEIRRYRNGLPVLSRASSVGYVFRKFVRRHRLAAAMLSMFITVLTGFSILLAIQANRLANERDRSNMEAEKALAVADFLENIFEASEQTISSDEAVTAKELLTSGVARIEDWQEDKPEVQALLMQVLGRTHFKMAFYASGETLLRKAVQKAIEVEGDESMLTAESKFYLAKTLIAQEGDGWAEESEALLREALDVQMKDGKNARAISATLFALGDLLHKKGDKAEAIELAREAIDLFEERFESSTPEDIERMFDMASLLRYAGDRAPAESLYIFLIENMNPEDPSVLFQLSKAHKYLASLYSYQNKHGRSGSSSRSILPT